MMTIQILPALYYEITVFCIPSIGCIQILKAMRSCPVPMPASLKKCIARLSQSLPIPVAAHPSEKMSTRQWLVPVLPRNTVPFLLICFMISNESEILFHHLQA